MTRRASAGPQLPVVTPPDSCRTGPGAGPAIKFKTPRRRWVRPRQLTVGTHHVPADCPRPTPLPAPGAGQIPHCPVRYLRRLAPRLAATPPLPAPTAPALARLLSLACRRPPHPPPAASEAAQQSPARPAAAAPPRIGRTPGLTQVSPPQSSEPLSLLPASLPGPGPARGEGGGPVRADRRPPPASPSSTAPSPSLGPQRGLGSPQRGRARRSGPERVACLQAGQREAAL